MQELSRRAAIGAMLAAPLAAALPVLPADDDPLWINLDEHPKGYIVTLYMKCSIYIPPEERHAGICLY